MPGGRSTRPSDRGRAVSRQPSAVSRQPSAGNDERAIESADLDESANLRRRSSEHEHMSHRCEPGVRLDHQPQSTRVDEVDTREIEFEITVSGIEIPQTLSQLRGGMNIDFATHRHQAMISGQLEPRGKLDHMSKSINCSLNHLRFGTRPQRAVGAKLGGGHNDGGHHITDHGVVGQRL
jgi:hypothetical protein